jgi:phosphoenolpyruvate synthase/pyruvate phosphate dikinase
MSQSFFNSLTVNLAEYTKFWELNNYSFLWHDIFVYSAYKNRLIENILGVQEKNLLCVCKEGKYSFYLKNMEIQKNKKQVLEFFTSQSYDKLAKSIERILIEAEQLQWTVQYSDWKEKFEWLSKKHTEASSLYFCTEAYYVDSIYDNLIDSGYEKKDILQYTVLLKMPKLIEEQLEWYNLIVSKPGNIDINLLIENHFNKWKNIIAKTRMEPYTINVLCKRYGKDIKNIDAVKQTHQDIATRYSAENIEKMIAVSKSIFDEKSYLLIRRLSEISYLRFELRRVWMKTGFLLRTLLEKVFPENENIFERSANEILNEDISNCDDRKSFIYYADEQNSLLFYNNTQERTVFIGEGSLENSNEVYGKISFGTDVYGYACILRNNMCLIDALEFVNKDTILILPQLCPEHVPLLGICKGIVVDEGGIAGHASIIAREMRKSAVLGTINGTERIKNNEYVHLDIASNCVRKIYNV